MVSIITDLSETEMMFIIEPHIWMGLFQKLH